MGWHQVLYLKYLSVLKKKRRKIYIRTSLRVYGAADEWVLQAIVLYVNMRGYILGKFGKDGVSSLEVWVSTFCRDNGINNSVVERSAFST